MLAFAARIEPPTVEHVLAAVAQSQAALVDLSTKLVGTVNGDPANILIQFVRPDLVRAEFFGGLLDGQVIVVEGDAQYTFQPLTGVTFIDPAERDDITDPAELVRIITDFSAFVAENFQVSLVDVQGEAGQRVFTLLAVPLTAALLDQVELSLAEADLRPLELLATSGGSVVMDVTIAEWQTNPGLNPDDLRLPEPYVDRR
ncbi:MAG: hypothetical protein HY335_08505 [Deinococcus sp.]|nr:hypothetical protein [Deinococcus sp.]